MKITPDMEPGVDVIKRELDFSQCKYLGEIHEVIREEFELPDWYGANLDALWDSVTGIMYTPADITVRKEVRSQELKPEIENIIEVLNEAQEKYGEICVHVIDSQQKVGNLDSNYENQKKNYKHEE